MIPLSPQQNLFCSQAPSSAPHPCFPYCWVKLYLPNRPPRPTPHSHQLLQNPRDLCCSNLSCFNLSAFLLSPEETSGLLPHLLTLHPSAKAHHKVFSLTRLFAGSSRDVQSHACWLPLGLPAGGLLTIIPWPKLCVNYSHWGGAVAHLSFSISFSKSLVCICLFIWCSVIFFASIITAEEFDRKVDAVLIMKQEGVYATVTVLVLISFYFKYKNFCQPISFVPGVQTNFISKMFMIRTSLGD